MATVEYSLVFLGGTVATLIGYAIFLIYSYLEHRKEQAERERNATVREAQVRRLLGAKTRTQKTFDRLRSEEDERAKERMQKGRPGSR